MTKIDKERLRNVVTNAIDYVSDHLHDSTRWYEQMDAESGQTYMDSVIDDIYAGVQSLILRAEDEQVDAGK